MVMQEWKRWNEKFRFVCQHGQVSGGGVHTVSKGLRDLEFFGIFSDFKGIYLDFILFSKNYRVEEVIIQLSYLKQIKK